MEMYLRMYGVSLATYCIMLFMLYKLYIFMLPRLNNTSTWKLEIYYRQLMRFRHEHGIQVWPDVHDNWLYAEVCTLLVYILAFLEAITVFAMVEVFNWNFVMKHIVIFHEENPNVTRPILSPELLEIPNSYLQTYMVDFMYINILMGLSLVALDRRFEDMRQEGDEVVKVLKLIFLVCASFYLSIIFNAFVVRCTEGQDELNLYITQ